MAHSLSGESSRGQNFDGWAYLHLGGKCNEPRGCEGRVHPADPLSAWLVEEAEARALPGGPMLAQILR